jgi:hypothetical protein
MYIYAIFHVYVDHLHIHGIYLVYPWINNMYIHGYTMFIHGSIPCISAQYIHGISMDIHGTSIDGYPWYIHGISMDIPEYS